jgi:F-type H+-transporting ATPase subunit epsilon
MAALHVRVVSPARTVFEGEASSVVAPAWDGKVGILPRHAPMITLLGAGVLTIDLVGGGSRGMHVAGGALQVLDDEVTVLTEYAGDAPPEQLPEGLVRPEDVGDYVLETLASGGNPLI